MKINKLEIENFKCFEKISIETPKITLLTGANSTGKSSLMYAILSAVQSSGFPFSFSPNGKYVRMGDYKEIVFNHETDREFKIGFEIESNFQMSKEVPVIKSKKSRIISTWACESNTRLPYLKKVEEISPSGDLQIRPENKSYISEFTIKDEDYKIAIIKFLKFSINFERDKYDHPTLQDIINQIQENGSVTIKYENLNDLSTFKSLYHHIEQGSDLLKIINEVDQHLNFISPYRQEPERTYYETVKTQEYLKVGKSGENYIDQIIEWQTRKDKRFEELIQIVKDLGLIEEIKAKRLSGGRFEILVKDKQNGVWASLTDVGFGISQFLPIIVADLQLGENSTLLVAQPEIHLHPQIQAKFADYLIKMSQEQNKNYIIETHSEYIINRLRLGIVKEEISSDDLKTYYLEKDKKGVKKYDLNFLKNGQIENAPEGFFETYMLDVMNIAIAATA